MSPPFQYPPTLPADDWAAQETPVKLADGSSNGYGLGVFTGSANGRRYVEHSGEAVGFLSENTVYSDMRSTHGTGRI